MMTEDEIQVADVDSEKAHSGSETTSQFDHVDFDSTIHRVNRISSQQYRRQGFGYIEPHEHEETTADGLPRQNGKTGPTMFLRRQVQMMSISTSFSRVL